MLSLERDTRKLVLIATYLVLTIVTSYIHITNEYKNNHTRIIQELISIQNNITKDSNYALCRNNLEKLKFKLSENIDNNIIIGIQIKGASIWKIGLTDPSKTTAHTFLLSCVEDNNIKSNIIEITIYASNKIVIEKLNINFILLSAFLNIILFFIVLYFNKLPLAFNKHLREITNTIPSILISLDNKGYIFDWNSSCEKYTGISYNNAIGNMLIDIYKPFADYIINLDEIIQTKKVRTFSGIKNIINDKVYYFDVNVSPIMADNCAWIIIRIDDITTKLKIAGTAHEINNPLGTILQSAQNINRRLDPKLANNQKVANEIGIDLEMLNKYLQIRKILFFINSISEAGKRAANIVANILQSSERTNSIKKFSNYESIIAKAISLAENDYALNKNYDFKNIKLIYDYQEQLPNIYCCIIEIEQVILNLLKNAAYALADNPEPTITLRLEKIKDAVQLTLRDNGSGIEQSLCKRIFEPFFTTKPSGEGTGLGLSISYNIIVDDHKGKMSVESELGLGTTFYISLPCKE